MTVIDRLRNSRGEYAETFPGFELIPIGIDGILIRILEFWDGDSVLRDLEQSLMESLLIKARTIL
jgi:hypothetical protein